MFRPQFISLRCVERTGLESRVLTVNVYASVFIAV